MASRLLAMKVVQAVAIMIDNGIAGEELLFLSQERAIFNG
jgi:hypothetical protein